VALGARKSKQFIQGMSIHWPEDAAHVCEAGEENAGEEGETETRVSKSATLGVCLLFHDTRSLIGFMKIR